MLDEENILKGVSKGDMRAFQDLYYEYYGKTKSFLAGFLRDPIVCEDLTQEIFVKVWTMRHILPELRSVNSYLYRMAKNAALNYLRCARREVYGMADIEDDEILEEAISAKQKLKIVGSVISNMPVKRRSIFLMSRIFGIPNDQIAEQMNVSKKTVENHINLAGKELRKVMAELLAVIFLIFLK
ncbi:MAG: RNA polymerase sigma-70 factor [Bacteroidales bacterium]|nr:RNA polymerase sigma-70 factor [Bacteroidales bacterium]MDY6001437.1 RNA polymerase sigma-70 factor [Candidatus Cryptobacteroides sp.]